MKTKSTKLRIIISALFLLFTIEAFDSYLFAPLDAEILPWLKAGITVGKFLLFAFLFWVGKKTFNDGLNQALQFKQLVDLSPEPVLIHRKGEIIYANPAVAELIGAPDSEVLLNRQVREFVQPDSYKEMESYERSNELNIQKICIDRWDKKTAEVEVISISVDFNGAPARKVIARDITQENEITAKLESYAFRDDLTGLLNRRGLAEEADKLIQKATAAHTTLGVLFIDLDGFKKVNDVHGHDKGDEVLKRVSEQLRGSTRDQDVLARVGGDEFVILVSNTSESDMKRLSMRIIDRMNATAPKFPRISGVTPSIGIALSPEHGTDLETLIAHADKAMYKAKRSGKNSFFLFREKAKTTY